MPWWSVDIMLIWCIIILAAGKQYGAELGKLEAMLDTVNKVLYY